MTINKILIADDKEENRKAALQAFPFADCASSAKQALELLASHDYDLVLTDMQMEKENSGLEVIAMSLRKSILCYTISNAGLNHGVESIEVTPYIDNIQYSKGKANPETWKYVLELISNAKGSHKSYQEVLSKIKGNSKSSKDPLTNIPDVVITALYAPWNTRRKAK